MKTNEALRLALPKGRMQAGVLELLRAAGIEVRLGERGYRPGVALDGVETKLLKPQNIVKMLHVGSRDIGFAGADWVEELQADVIELLDTGLDAVRIVAAAPAGLASLERLASRRITVASEYQRLGADWIARRGLDALLVHSYGATEVFPPEDADCIIDNSASGSTLRDNHLEIVDELMRSSTRLYANPAALEQPHKRRAMEDLTMLLHSVLEARQRVMVEVNVAASALEALVEVLPCMREPTIARLHGEEGYAVKAAVQRELLPALIPTLKQCGATDIVVANLAQIVP